jgi:hypothetical protein
LSRVDGHNPLGWVGLAASKRILANPGDLQSGFWFALLLKTTLEQRDGDGVRSRRANAAKTPSV